MNKNAGAVNCRFQRKNRGLGGIAQARPPGVLRTRKIAFNLGTRQLRSMLILGDPVFHDVSSKMHVFNVHVRNRRFRRYFTRSARPPWRGAVESMKTREIALLKVGGLRN